MLKKKIAILLAAVLVLGAAPTAVYATADDTAAASATSGASTTATEDPAAAPAEPAPAPSAPAPARVPASGQPAGTEYVNAAGQTVYVVAQDDFLWKIAAKYGLTYQEIAAANNLSNPSLIFVGQELIIPGAGQAVPVAPETPAVPAEPADAVASATPNESYFANAADLIKGLGEDGTWITIALADVTLPADLYVAGATEYGDAVVRKLALYDQDADYAVTKEYTLTAPNIIVGSPNFSIQEGKVIGNIIVNAEGFNLRNTEVTGNITFATQAAMDSADITTATVSGTVSAAAAEAPAATPVEEPAAEVTVTTPAAIERTSEEIAEVIAGATPNEGYFSNEEELAAALGEEGPWIVIALADVTAGDVAVNGTIVHNNANARKLALYDQGEDYSITAEYTLTVDNLDVYTPGFYIQNGRVVGDINVYAEGFELRDAEVEGNINFDTQELLDASTIDPALVSGEIGLGQFVIAEEDIPFEGGVMLRDVFANAGGVIEATKSDPETNIVNVIASFNGETLTFDIDGFVTYSGTVTLGDKTATFGAYHNLGFNYIMEDEFIAALTEVGVFEVEAVEETEAETEATSLIALLEAKGIAVVSASQSEETENAVVLEVTLADGTVAEITVDLTEMTGSFAAETADITFDVTADDEDVYVIEADFDAALEAYLAAVAE